MRVAKRTTCRSHDRRPRGKFIPRSRPAGRFVKSADADIIAELDSRGFFYLLLHYTHEYPFCCAVDTSPLLRDGIVVDQDDHLRDKLSPERGGNWVPEYIKEDASAVAPRRKDWAFSREVLGHAAPIWICEGCEARPAWARSRNSKPAPAACRRTRSTCTAVVDGLTME
jgi:isoleucyl-tRNA synthetase